MATLDGDHYRTAELVSELISNAHMNNLFDLIKCLQPEFSKDGNMFCYMYGTPPQNYIAGYGETVHLAMVDFHRNFYQQKA